MVNMHYDSDIPDMLRLVHQLFYTVYGFPASGHNNTTKKDYLSSGLCYSFALFFFIHCKSLYIAFRCCNQFFISETCGNRFLVLVGGLCTPASDMKSSLYSHA